MEKRVWYIKEEVDEQTIRFTKLLVLEDQTIGEGIIPEENKFAFNPQFGFKGNVRLEGSQKELFYDGAYQVKHECTLIPTAWVKFNAYVGTEKNGFASRWGSGFKWEITTHRSCYGARCYLPHVSFSSN